MNQSWEYNQFSYPGKEGSETEIPDARLMAAQSTESHRRREVRAEKLRVRGREEHSYELVCVCGGGG